MKQRRLMASVDALFRFLCILAFVHAFGAPRHHLQMFLPVHFFCISYHFLDSGMVWFISLLFLFNVCLLTCLKYIISCCSLLAVRECT
ncbi:hypothetical protein DFH11DRAFT_1615294 [Phellopilus nigrolimitatus]|nr:hypothetical protein DFH11DRAFT_1615294 [Phellopilus nigrolimitatus]